MEQLVTYANQLIACILNWMLFLMVYGVIFYCLGVVIFRIIRVLFDRFSPTWKRWYASAHREKRLQNGTTSSSCRKDPYEKR